MSEIPTPTHDTYASDEVFTMEEACRFLKVSRVTMHRLLKVDEALLSHGRKLGGRWRFTKRGLLNYIDGKE